MTVTMPQATVLAQVALGELDGIIGQLADAVHSRRRFLNEQQAVSNQVEFTPGTRVELGGNLRPMYLQGVTGSVSRTPASRRGDLKVDIDAKYAARLARGRYANPLSVPAHCLTKIA